MCTLNIASWEAGEQKGEEAKGDRGQSASSGRMTPYKYSVRDLSLLVFSFGFFIIIILLLFLFTYYYFLLL